MKLRSGVGAVLVAALILNGANAQDESDLRVSSRQVAVELTQSLGAKLREELARGGPDGAIAVCKTLAPTLAGELSLRNGWHVARVSLKTRNPLLGMPDAWEQEQLAEFDRRAAAGEKLDALEAGAIVDEPQGRFYRYLKAIPVQPMCLTCHGSEASIPASVREQLRADYPHDRAVGYSAGQVRGAVTIKRPL